MTHRSIALARLAGCLLAEVAALVLIAGIGVGRSGPPPLDRSVTQWWAAQDPLDAAAGVGRVIAILLATYLVAVTSLHLVAVATRGRRLGRIASRLGPRFLAGLAATAVLGSGSAMASTTDRPTPSGSGAVMEMLVDSTPSRTWLPWADGVTTGAAPASTPTAAATPTVQVPDPPTPPPPTNAAREVTVHRGDSMWTIARDELASRLARTPTVAEIDPYWRDLIELNRSRLVDPANPSLIYPDQTFELP